MNNDIIAPLIALIVMVGWAVHFAVYQRAIFTRSRREVMVWALVSVVIVSVTMQVLYRITMWLIERAG
jgi:hypothetical protein